MTKASIHFDVYNATEHKEAVVRNVQKFCCVHDKTECIDPLTSTSTQQEA